MSMHLLSRCTVVVVLLACEPPVPQRESPPAASLPPAPDSAAPVSIPDTVQPSIREDPEPDSQPTVDATFAQLAESLVGEIRAGVSLRAWVDGHPADSDPAWFDKRWSDFSPNHSGPTSFMLGDWCARTTARGRLRDGRAWTRRTYFYPPDTPQATLPPLADSAALRWTGCRLGLVWLESPEPDSLHGIALAKSIGVSLKRMTGPGEPFPTPGEPFATEYPDRPHTWRAASAWRAADRGLITTYETDSLVPIGPCTYAHGEDCEPPTEDRRGPLVIAFLPRATIGADRFAKLDAYDNDPEWQPEIMLDLALRAAAVDSARARPLVELVRQLSHQLRDRYGEVVSPVPGDSILAVVEPWLADTRRLSSEQRGGALLAADIVLGMERYAFKGLADSVARARLAALGATYENRVGSAGYYYYGSLRREPGRLIVSRPLADSLFAALVEHPPICAPIDSLALEAARYAARTESREMRARAHLMAAAGHADRYLFTGAAAPRRAAVEHYTAAFAAAPTERLRQRAWDEGWRLVAGLAPVRIRFQCYEGD